MVSAVFSPLWPRLTFGCDDAAEGDSLSLCEAVMAVLLNWCGTWAEMFPYPPLGELGRVRMLLEYHDPQLADHLQQCNATPDVFAWPMLRTLLSEVLSRDEVRQVS